MVTGKSLVLGKLRSLFSAKYSIEKHSTIDVGQMNTLF